MEQRPELWPLFLYGRRKSLGIQQSDLFICLSAHHAAALLHGPAGMAEPGAAGGEPVFLWLGRTGVHRHHVRLYPHRLYPWPVGGEVPPRRSESPVVCGTVRGVQPAASGLFQVLGLPGGQSLPDPRYQRAPVGDPAAHRHLFLHIPDHELYHRRLPTGEEITWYSAV